MKTFACPSFALQGILSIVFNRLSENPRKWNKESNKMTKIEICQVSESKGSDVAKW